MNNVLGPVRAAIARAARAAAVAVLLAGSASAGPVEHLSGRWTGWGQMTMDGGNTEKVKCIATYFLGPNSRQLKHNLRCASTNYSIDAIAELTVDSGSVSGSWEERKYSTGGEVSGRVVGDSIDMSIVGQAFKASMKIETSACQQTMNIAPKGMGVARIAVKLSKC